MIAGYPRAAPGESARVQHYNPLHDATLTSTQEGGTVGAHQTGQHTAPPASSQIQELTETSRTGQSTLGPLSTLDGGAINGAKQSSLPAYFLLGWCRLNEPPGSVPTCGAWSLS